MTIFDTARRARTALLVAALAWHAAAMGIDWGQPGSCGAADGVPTASTPTALCTNGDALNFSGSGPWSWQCFAGTTVNCSAPLLAPTPINGACGNSNGGYFTSAPGANLCSTGSAGAVSGSGPWNWTCAGSNGGTSASCSANLEVGIRGVCGSANGTGINAAPTDNLCQAGTPGSVTGSGPWAWTCRGIDGGADASCSAGPIPGVCGPTHGSVENTAPGTGLCSTGNASVLVGSGPWSWTCSGSRGGTDASCQTAVVRTLDATATGSTYALNANGTYQVTEGAATFQATLALPYESGSTTNRVTLLLPDGSTMVVEAQVTGTRVQLQFTTLPNGTKRIVVVPLQGVVKLNPGAANQPTFAPPNSTTTWFSAQSGSSLLAGRIAQVVSNALGGSSGSGSGGSGSFAGGSFAGGASVSSGGFTAQSGGTGGSRAAPTIDRIYAGEQIAWDAQGVVQAAWFGSASGQGAAGDPVSLQTLGGLSYPGLSVPRLDAVAARLGTTLLSHFGAQVQASLNGNFEGTQGPFGTLAVSLNGGQQRQSWLPVGSVTIDTSRSDGARYLDSGLLEITRQGVSAVFAPGLIAYDTLLSSLGAASATLQVGAIGTVRVDAGGATFVLQPAWSHEACSATGLTFSAAGQLSVGSRTGRCQALYPAIGDLAAVRDAIASVAPTATLQVRPDAALDLTAGAARLTLWPGYTLDAVPAGQAGAPFWPEADGRLSIRYPALGKAQAFRLQ